MVHEGSNGLHGYNVVKIQNVELSLDKDIDFKD
jgi:hypothetical protein